MVFVNSMSDLFHKRVERSFVDKVFDTMESVDRHIYQILTKHSSLMRNYPRRRYSGASAPGHIWCGVSVEDSAATIRIKHLQQSPATVRILSLEPLLGPIDHIDIEGISWVIVGGESGPRARPLRPEWVRQIRDRCAREGVAFFFKQWGGATSKAGSRQLEGTEHNTMPANHGERQSDPVSLAP